MIFSFADIINCFQVKSRLLVILFLIFSFHIFAQKTDTATVKNITKTNTKPADTVKANLADTFVVKKHSPKKALMMSACLPGLGQAYNRKYWKMPIIYAGAAAITYFINFNSKYYKDFKKAYMYRTDGNNATIDNYPFVTTEDLLTLKDYYRRDLELTYIIGGALYALNIIDAAVDANLYKFDISDDLSLNINPAFFSFRNHAGTGLTFAFTISQTKKKQLSRNY